MNNENTVEHSRPRSEIAERTLTTESSEQQR